MNMFMEELFATRMHTKVLRTLAEKNTAYSLEEIMLESSGSRGAVYKVIAGLKKLGVVDVVKGRGKREFYRLNSNNQLYQPIAELFATEKLYRKLIPLHIWNRLERFADESTKKIKLIEKIILFGSVARGDYTPHSDVDILVIVNSVREKDRILIKDIFDKYLKKGSVLIENKSDWEKQEKGKTQLYQEIQKEGMELWKRR